MDDCLRGDDPSAVFFGERDRGGGRCVRLLRSIWCEVVRSGIEPSDELVSARKRESADSPGRILSCISIDSDAVMVPPRFGGDFSGEEKMPETGSRPFAS
jgi:hypothetical protein